MKNNGRSVVNDNSGANIGDIIINGILDELENDQILENVFRQFPEADTTPGCVMYYRNKIDQRGPNANAKYQLMYKYYRQGKSKGEIHRLIISEFPSQKISEKTVGNFISHMRLIDKIIAERNE